MTNVDLTKMSTVEREALLKQLKEIENKESLERRDAYEGIKKQVIDSIEQRVRKVGSEAFEAFILVRKEMSAFYDVMIEYGQLSRGEGQGSFTIDNGSFKIEVISKKKKKFDERADIAAQRLIVFLKSWINKSENGKADPMYLLAMTLLERNRAGDLDYDSISKLYKMESDFADPEYSGIMNLFKESTVPDGTATHYYFSERTEYGVWKRYEISFNRFY